MYRPSNYSFYFRKVDMPLVNSFKIKSNPLAVYKIINKNNNGLRYSYKYKIGLNKYNEGAGQSLKFEAKNVYFYEGFGVFTTLKDTVRAIPFMMSSYNIPNFKVIECFINPEHILGARMFYKYEGDDRSSRPSYSSRRNTDILYSHDVLYTPELWITQLTINSLNDIS